MAWLMEMQAEALADDTRAAERRTLHLGVEALAPAGKSIAATVMDMSKTGLLLQTKCTLPLGSALEVNLPEAGTTEAEVVWASGDFLGCRFISPVSQAAVSAALLRTDPSAAQTRKVITSGDELLLSDMASADWDAEFAEPATRLSPVIKVSIIAVSSLLLWTGVIGTVRLLAQII
jgi:PilZ domain